MARACACCQEEFTPRDSRQRYCLQERCRRRRKSEWQKRKLATDGSYRESQADAQRLWREKRPGYMREYRAQHPEYVAWNRDLQRERRKRGFPRSPLLPPEEGGVVKMDAGRSQPHVISGTYELLPIGVVKMDAVRVQLTVLEGVT